MAASNGTPLCDSSVSSSSEEKDVTRSNNLGNIGKIPSVVVEDTSIPVARSPSKVGNKDFEVKCTVMTGNTKRVFRRHEYTRLQSIVATFSSGPSRVGNWRLGKGFLSTQTRWDGRWKIVCHESGQEGRNRPWRHWKTGKQLSKLYLHIAFISFRHSTIYQSPS